MQMHESKVNATRNNTSSSSSSSVRLSYTSGSGNTNNNSSSSSSGGVGGVGNSGGSGVASLPSFNNQVTSSANNHTSTSDTKQKGKKKSTRDRQAANDDKSVMSNLSSYSLIDDDHIDDQETINVGNLIIDLESDLEKEKFENEQANSANNNDTDVKSSTSNPVSATSSTSPIATPSSSSSSSTPNKSSNSNTNNNNNNNNNSCSIKSLNHSIESKPGAGKSNQKPPNKHQKESANASTLSNPANINVNNGHVSTRTVFKSSADERGELKMKITRETKPSKSDHKVVTSPPLTSSGMSNNDLGVVSRGNNCDNSVANDTTPSTFSISSTKECGTSTSIGTITEPECLGPCEPGTSVNLEGIVWQETDGGILVVNVTWRGKTYVGALLDCTRHDWAPPRLCDSPASDIDAKASKGVRAKRIVTRSNGVGLDEKNLLQTTGKLRNGKGRRIPSASESTSCNKKSRETSEKASESTPAQAETNTPQANMSLTNSETAIVPMNVDATNNSQQEPQAASNSNPLEETGPISPMLIGCTEPNCSKKFRNMNGLLYHQSHAHSAENDPANPNDDCSSSTKDKDATTVIEEPPADNSEGSPNPSNDETDPSTNDPKDDRDGKREHQQQQHQMQHMLQSHGQKRERTSSPEVSVKMSNKPHSDTTPNMSLHENRLSRNDSPRISYVRGMDPERRHSSSSNVGLGVGGSGSGSGGLAPKSSESHRSPHGQQKHHFHEHHGSSTSVGHDQHTSSTSSYQTSKSSSQNPKQSTIQPPPMLPATTEEGMKPSGTSTGPPPAPHQANCYFNPAFLANTFNPYGLPPYPFPRHMYDPLAPPNIPTSNAAFLTRFMNNMRVPPPADSPSRLLSPSMRAGMPPTGPGSSHPLPNMSPLSNPTSLPPGPMPPIPPLPLPPMMGGSVNMRMPSQGDPSLMPPSSQQHQHQHHHQQHQHQQQPPPPLPPPFLHPTGGLNPAALGLPPGLGNPLGPMGGGPQVPSLVDDSLAKQFPRRFN